MTRNDIPSTRYIKRNRFEDFEKSLTPLKSDLDKLDRELGIVPKSNSKRRGEIFVIKTCNSNGEKMVFIAMGIEKALSKLQRINKDKPTECTIELFETGPEITVVCFWDGSTDYVMLPPAHVYSSNLGTTEGPIKGGRRCIAPAPHVSDKTMDLIEESIIKPTLKGMIKEGRDFSWKWKPCVTNSC